MRIFEGFERRWGGALPLALGLLGCCAGMAVAASLGTGVGVEPAAWGALAAALGVCTAIVGGVAQQRKRSGDESVGARRSRTDRSSTD